MAWRRALRFSVISNSANAEAPELKRLIRCACYTVSRSVTTTSPPGASVAPAASASDFAASAGGGAPAHYTSASGASVAAESAIRDGPRNNWKREEFQSVYDAPGASVAPAASASAHYTPASGASVAAESAIREGPRNDWNREEIQCIYDSPLVDLLFHGAQVHRHAHRFREVQQCTLLSIKTGGCSEDCSYCPQSSRYDTPVKASRLLGEDVVLEAAKKAKEAGSTRFCMGAAWRDTVGRKSNFNQILEYVKEIRGMGMEVCCTLGMLEEKQAQQLKTAGLTAYNHNLDTSREYYPKVITTRSYDERLKTLELVRDAGISVCSGGIIGMGEADEDRVGLLHTLATLPEHPESVPINALLAVKGTPLENQKPVEIWEMIRMIATTRIVMPNAMVRLSAGRVRFSQPEQALCFLAGANSIFVGEKLLTTPNNDQDADQQMFKILGLIPKAPNFEQGKSMTV